MGILTDCPLTNILVFKFSAYECPTTLIEVPYHHTYWGSKLFQSSFCTSSREGERRWVARCSRAGRAPHTRWLPTPRTHDCLKAGVYLGLGYPH